MRQGVQTVRDDAGKTGKTDGFDYWSIAARRTRFQFVGPKEGTNWKFVLRCAAERTRPLGEARRAPRRIPAEKEDRTVRALHFDCFSGISVDMSRRPVAPARPTPDSRPGPDSENRSGLQSRLTVEKGIKGGFAAIRSSSDAPEERRTALPDVEEPSCT